MIRSIMLLFAAVSPNHSARLIDYKIGKTVWKHAYLTNTVTNAPEAYSLDGRQYLLTTAGDTLYSFVLH